MSDEVWTAEDGLEEGAPLGANTTEDEPEPEELDQYEDVVHEPHDFGVADGGSTCVTCGEFYPDGNHTD